MQSIAAAREHFCALTKAGVVWCWGRNTKGQAGVAATPREVAVAPTVVPLPAPARSIDTQWDTSCALLEDRRVYCWGDRPSSKDPHVPEPMTELPPADTMVVTKRHGACVIDELETRVCSRLTG